MERSAARDVERLHAAADCKDREVTLGRASQQGELVLVGRAVDVRPELRVPALSLDGRVEVRTAAEDEAVDAGEQRGSVSTYP